MAAPRWLARRVMGLAEQRASFFSLSPSSSSSSAPIEHILCGRGDKKTKRGKRFKGSYGNARPKKEKKIERIKDRVEVPRGLSFLGEVDKFAFPARAPVVMYRFLLQTQAGLVLEVTSLPQTKDSGAVLKY
ncbi:hypothetical protein J5N97_025356 [Dioscorea zingiberensis]|uniref:30S ribosomal protein S31, mitochondrial n=1 Tax=Dioscorea zingiberensis TaxID=325984 RepID=A0A9D5C8K3_9LILI|nr:hypothetical protein J5N97_025356 [Dioscorea zingiberensis]